MGLHKQYLKYGQSARDQLFGPNGGNNGGGIIGGGVGSNNGGLIGGGMSMSNSNGNGVSTGIGSTGVRMGNIRNRATPISMLISQGAKISNHRLAVIILGIVTLILGILLSSIPWLDYFILKNLRLWNNTLSFHYWQRPGVIRLTKVYIYNVTNPDGFLSGEKPKLTEVGPFVYREDMEKVNVKFHDNFTVSFQHKKILQFVPELSIDKNTKIVTPNIPLLTLTSQSNSLGYFISKTISVALTAARYKPFISVTADQLVFGYDDALVSLAHRFYPQKRRPMSRMGLLIGRNGTLSEVLTINTGHNGMDKFGYLSRLNGLENNPAWTQRPCTSIEGSEGSFFPPRDITKSDYVNVYDKDLCRVIPLQYQHSVEKDGIDTDLYELADNAYGESSSNTKNQCFDLDEFDPPRGLQNIKPCHYGAPVFISNPHFYKADQSLQNSVEGLTPNKSLHKTYFKIQPKLGVPLEGQVRIQLNLKVDQAKYITSVKDFRDFVFPVMWLEEGITELTPSIRRWIYLATVFAPVVIPIGSYLMIVSGALAIVFVFVRAYQSFVFARDPTLEILEMGRRSLRRGSSFITQQQHKFMMQRDSYVLLKQTASQNDERSDSPT